MPTVALPPQLTTSPVFDLIADVQEAAASGAVDVDCAPLTFVRPFAALHALARSTLPPDMAAALERLISTGDRCVMALSGRS